ncbi:GntR family transcriptional regulator [Amphibacillus jilinensis]|uniref:GntR family transcriptional regulator n=1 Tax=Amphibacillus jilinensis TaxID=1216008 RepID=UPI0003122681|nr:GntR family transcriptional regulator [Amphibacillus jilinensis]
MSQEFQASKPIYMQIVDQIIIDILQGTQKVGDKLWSVREMAVKMGVNPNTIQRAYAELERMGAVETRRGQGTFVINNPELFATIKLDMQREIINRYVIDMKQLGVSSVEMIDQLKAFVEGGEEHDD